MQQTLVDFWEQLSPKQRRLIWDLLRANFSRYRNLSMGLLPFIPVKFVVRMLRHNPMSPWTFHLFNDEVCRDDWLIKDKYHSRYERSKEVDSKDYAEIINILSPPKPEPPSQLAVQMELWRKRYLTETGGENADTTSN